VTLPGGIGANNGITTDGITEYTPDPRIPKKTEEVVSTGMASVRSMKAIDDLNRSMNACMHAENQYLTKVKTYRYVCAFLYTCIHTYMNMYPLKTRIYFIELFLHIHSYKCIFT
jgi:hypothetical protein